MGVRGARKREDSGDEAKTDQEIIEELRKEIQLTKDRYELKLQVSLEE